MRKLRHKEAKVISSGSDNQKRKKEYRQRGKGQLHASKWGEEKNSNV